ncbi:RNA polymerase sigma factor [Paraburkholderia caribensis]|uniref:RNA polymerase sigma factor n=1 Tax=Paraburkholderia caribensis TaxID=75105 RepID=UPI00071FA887|nr:RNA polymerase sigma factor [Paraburkholderia caribensis]ALP68757.1 RNA polymerase subunit sigma-24 [Paraburkholderia caribensis]AUT58116.1 RNA polymerase sigma factor [Paraburkholderia caribensis]
MNIRSCLAEHLPHLRRYARALIRNSDLADDLVQDALERALRNDGQFRPGSDLRAWLFAIMHNLHVNQTLRSRARGPHVAIDDETISDAAFAVGANQTAGMEIRDLDLALQRLPAEQREVVLLVGLEELSYAETASALGIPIGTVMSRLARGRERLRAVLVPNDMPGTAKLARVG